MLRQWRRNKPMRNKLSHKVAIALSALLACGQASAMDLEIGLIGEDFTYEEGTLMEEQGTLYGVMLRMAQHTREGWGGEVIATFRRGSLDYEGHTWGGDPVSTGTKDRVWTIQGNVGYELSGVWTDTFIYTGLGRRTWNQELRGEGGYRREITWYFMPLGICTHGRFDAPGWDWVLRLEGQAIFAGKVRSMLSDRDPRIGDVENAVDKGHGFFAGLSIRREIKGDASKAMLLSLTPYYQVWDVERSNEQVLYIEGQPADLVVYEPANDTREVGMRVTLTF